MNEWRIDPDGWNDAVAAHEGPQLVVAGPGAGKTEFLVRRALHLIDEVGIRPDELLLLSFSRRSASDLRERLVRALHRSFTTVPASTFHSLSLRLLETHGAGAFGWASLPSLLTSPEQVAFVARLLAEERPQAWPAPFRPLLHSATFAGEVADFLLRCQEQLIDPEQLEERAADRADWRGLPGFFARYREELKDSGRLDYGALQASAVDLLGRPDVAAQVAEQHPFVLVDEYQDTTVAQAELLKRLTAPHRNLVVAGDPYQSIYSFRGAELHNIKEFPNQFRDTAGRPARRMVLTTSFRVPADILEAAVRVTAGGRLPGAAGRVVPAAGKGSVETYGFDQASHEAAWIAAEVQRRHLLDTIPYHRMAVLVRSKRRFLPELSRALDRHGIPHDRPDARLVDRPAVRLVFDCVLAATETGPDRDAALRRLLLGGLFGLALGTYRDLERRRHAGEGDWADLLRRFVPGGPPFAALIDDHSWATDKPAAAGFWHLWTHLPHLPDLVADPGRGRDRAAWSSLSQVLTRLLERDPGVTLRGFLALSEAEEFEATPLLRFDRPDEDRLTLTTLHQAKGLDFEVVFIADAVEGTFPDLRARESLLGSRHLSTSQPADPAGYAAFRLQEEMRLAYTAMGRARRRVVWTATTGSGAHGDGTPSRFLSLVAGTKTVAEAARLPADGHRDPVTALEAEAWLRRTARDPAEPEAVRLAAIAAMGDGERWGLRPPTCFAGFLQPGPDDGLLPEHLVLSPSQAEAYDRCPRRYAFERRLHVGDEATVYAEFGSLIHDVLEAAETRALERGDDHADFEEAAAELDRLWDPTPFAGEPWAASWRVRAERTLAHLYDHWPTGGRVAFLERNLELEIDGVPWRGRADRLEIEDGRVRVVDYKTGTHVVRVDDAAASLQLGFYYLAATEDPEIRRHGRVAEAELWYPRDYDKKSLTRRYLDPALIGTVELQLAAAAAGIAAEQWPPRPAADCDRCRVLTVCPVWPEGKEAFSA